MRLLCTFLGKTLPFLLTSWGSSDWGEAPFPSSYLQGQSRVVQDDIPLHHHLGLIRNLAYGCDPDHVVCLQVSTILRVCDLHRILYF